MVRNIKFLLAVAVIAMVAAYVVLKQESLPVFEQQTELDTFLTQLYEYAKHEMPQLRAETDRLLDAIHNQIQASTNEEFNTDESLHLTQDELNMESVDESQQVNVPDKQYLRKGVDLIRERLQGMDSEELAEKIRLHFQMLYEQNPDQTGETKR